MSETSSILDRATCSPRPLQPSGSTLADYLHLLLPPVTSSLFTEAAKLRIVLIARHMLPIPRIALEFRLLEEAAQVDLQQSIRRDAGEYANLAAYAADLSAQFAQGSGSGSCFVRFASFCDDLAKADSVLGANVAELFLEFDLTDDEQVPLPSVFLSLPDESDLAQRVTWRAMELLGGEQSLVKLQGAIAQCFRSCPGNAYVSNVGIMLSRPTDAVRVNVKGLLPADVEPYLRACGYPADAAAAARTFDGAVEQAERVTLALDVGQQVYPRVGFECFYDEQPQTDFWWKFALQDLCDQGLAERSKADHFLALRADLNPASGHERWPREYVVRSLQRPASDFSTFARRLIHLKMTETVGRPTEAKAYLGAGHLWVTPGDATLKEAWMPELASAPQSRSRLQTRANTSRLQASVQRGVQFLLDRQLQSGFWRDFRPYGISDEWVSSFIAVQLMGTNIPEATEAAQRCCSRLRTTQRANGGWGYSRHQAPDSDSTAWALRLLKACDGEQEQAYVRGLEFLHGHVQQDGSVRTYRDHADLAPRIGLAQTALFAGWEQGHVCVTAAAAPFLQDSTRALLRASQQEGRWCGYWWVHDAYATAMSVEALQRSASADDEAQIAAAKRWAASCLASGGDLTAFDIAFCMRVLASGGLGDFRPAAEHAVTTLLGQQAQSGGWAPSARLRIPMPASADPGAASTRVVLDYRANFTTAAVVGALTLAGSEGIRG